MIAADDPRHGTVAGYNRIPCRDECCRRAMATYKARWEWDQMNGRDRIVPTVGTRRRIQALNAIGWPNDMIARHLGCHGSNFTRLLSGSTMTRRLADDIAALYDRLSMQQPAGITAKSVSYARNRAIRNGWPPPLAWPEGSIDDPDYEPTNWAYRPPTRVELLADLDDQHAGLSEVLRTLDVTREALERWCERNGCREVYVRLRDREERGRECAA